MNSNIIWFIPAGTVALGIFLLSTTLSIPGPVDGVRYLDKIEHCFAYSVLIISFMIAFKKAGSLTSKRAVQILVFASLYGFGLELVQYTFFPNRFFEWWDASANILGVILGFGIFKLVSRVC